MSASPEEGRSRRVGASAEERGAGCVDMSASPEERRAGRIDMNASSENRGAGRIDMSESPAASAPSSGLDPGQLSRPLLPLVPGQRDAMEKVLAHYAALPVLAWWRVPEILLLRRVPMRGPVLDLGCGDGRMAELAVTDRRLLALGIDLSTKDLRRAQRRGTYRLLLRANLRRPLPVGDGTFATVFSNSVFEHIPGVQPVFAEVRRVLRPGGHLVFTVPSEHLNDMLRWPKRIASALGSPAATRWQRWWDAQVAHVNLGGRPYWTRALECAGLELLLCQSLLGARTIATYERWQLLHNVGLGRVNAGNVVRALTEGPARLGWDVPQRALVSRTRRILEGLLDGEPADPGANLLFVARRPD